MAVPTIKKTQQSNNDSGRGARGIIYSQAGALRKASGCPHKQLPVRVGTVRDAGMVMPLQYCCAVCLL